MRVVRGFVAEHLADQPLVVAVLDESGQEKTGETTAGVQRQYMGCGGRIANGVNTVYCSSARPAGTPWSAPGSMSRPINSPTRLAATRAGLARMLCSAPNPSWPSTSAAT
jgi:hypothetical protein